MSLQLYQSYRPILSFAFSYIIIIIYFYIGKKYLSKNYFHHTYLSAFVVCNSTYLNIFYDYNYFLLLPLVIFLSINIKLFFRKDNERRSMLNPSLASIFILSLLFPQLVSYGSNLWSSELWQVLTVLVIGIFVTYTAKTFIISLSYILTYIISSFLVREILSLDIFSLHMTLANPLSWILSLFSVGKLIFIFHVITDPQSGPKETKGKILFGCSIGLIEIILKYFNILNNIIIAYIFVLTIFLIIEDLKEKRVKLSNSELC